MKFSINKHKAIHKGKSTFLFQILWKFVKQNRSEHSLA